MLENKIYKKIKIKNTTKPLKYLHHHTNKKIIPTPSSQASNVLRIFFGEQREYAIYTKQFHILFWGQGQGMPFSGTIIPVALRCGLIEFNN